jgi:hypothetical protein
LRGVLVIPLLVALGACDQPTTSEPLAPEASFAKSGGSHAPLRFRWNDDGKGAVSGVYSDTEGDYVDGEDIGSLPVRAYFSVGGGRNAYLVTYHSTRELCFDFPDVPVVQTLVTSGEFPGLGFCAQSDMFLVNRPAYESMAIMPESLSSTPWEWTGATWPSLEIEFYPRGTTEVTYDLHFSSLRLIRTASGTWEAVTHDNTQTVLSVVRRKSNQRLGVVDVPTAFTMMLK